MNKRKVVVKDLLGARWYFRTDGSFLKVRSWRFWKRYKYEKVLDFIERYQAGRDVLFGTGFEHADMMIYVYQPVDVLKEACFDNGRYTKHVMLNGEKPMSGKYVKEVLGVNSELICDSFIFNMPVQLKCAVSKNLALQWTEDGMLYLYIPLMHASDGTVKYNMDCEFVVNDTISPYLTEGFVEDGVLLMGASEKKTGFTNTVLMLCVARDLK